MPLWGDTSQSPFSMDVDAIPTTGLLEFQEAGGTVELGVTEAEDPAIRSQQPVALAVGDRGHGNDGSIGMEAHRAEGPDGTEGVHLRVLVATQ